MEQSGLVVFVYRDARGSDCTNGGVTSKFDHMVLIDPKIRAPFTVSNTCPGLKLVRRNFGGSEYIHAEPLEQPKGRVGPMFGGNYISSSDSRFREICQYPIPVHDRFETQVQYDSNCD